MLYIPSVTITTTSFVGLYDANHRHLISSHKTQNVNIVGDMLQALYVRYILKKMMLRNYAHNMYLYMYRHTMITCIDKSC